MSRARPATLAAGALALALAGLPAAAQPSRVTLATRGDEARAGAFRASLGELLTRLQLTLEAHQGDGGTQGAGGAVAAVEAAFDEPEACTLTVVDAAGRTVLLRRLPRAASLALQAEAAAHVVQAVVEELLALSRWQPPAVEPPPLPEPPLEPAPAVEPVAAEPAAEPAPRGPLGLDLGAFFGGRTFLNGAPVTAGGGLTASLALELGRFRPMLTLLGDYHAPFERGDPLVSIRLESFSARALVSLDALGGAGYRVDVALGGGADVLFSSPSSEVLGPSRLRPRADADPVLTAMVTGRLAIAASVDLYLALALDVDLWPVQYIGTVPRGSSVLFYRVYPVRPSLVLGFSFNALGADPYRGAR